MQRCTEGSAGERVRAERTEEAHSMRETAAAPHEHSGALCAAPAKVGALRLDVLGVRRHGRCLLQDSRRVFLVAASDLDGAKHRVTLSDMH